MWLCVQMLLHCWAIWIWSTTNELAHLRICMPWHRLLHSADLDVCCSNNTACSSLHDAWLLNPTSQCESHFVARCWLFLWNNVSRRRSRLLQQFYTQGQHKGLLHDLLAKPSISSHYIPPGANSAHQRWYKTIRSTSIWACTHAHTHTHRKHKC